MMLLSVPADAKNCDSHSADKAPSAGETQPVAGGPSGATQPSNIVQIASRNASFSTLTRAVKAAGLVDTLSGQGPFTVFAPTDAAFADLERQAPGTLETLLKPENKAKLVQILTYHVVPGSVKSTQLKAGNVKTVEGSAVAVNLDGGKVMVNQANVISADLEASNGVIHVIDKVILPPNL
nr:fasciclin domain-containing protein [Ancylothrix sp. D3o]